MFDPYAVLYHAPYTQSPQTVVTDRETRRRGDREAEAGKKANVLDRLKKKNTAVQEVEK